LEKGVLEPRAVKQLRNTNSKSAKSELLLDMLMGKNHNEFLTFCEVLRVKANCGHLADLLLSLDCLVDLGSEDSLKKRQNSSSCGELNSDINSCSICTEHSSQDPNDLLMDTTNFDVEIVYIDKSTGAAKNQKEVAAMKLDKLQTCDSSVKVPDELAKHEADR
jgi:hypothetical protein